MPTILLGFMLALAIAAAMTACDRSTAALPATPLVAMPPPDPDALQPDPDHPMYWRYRGRPVLLLGGSAEDNLFQIDGLEEHLDLLVSVGGNYVRCTMSDRDKGDARAFVRDEATGKYDLTKLNDEYWSRFDRFLELTAARGIIVQIELWDRFDHAREMWLADPYNPANNSTYTTQQSGLQTVYDKHPASFQHPFFRSIPELDDNRVLYDAQRRFIDRLLASTLRHDHVLYCMDNETKEDERWGIHWATVIQKAAAAAGRRVYCTQMWDPWDITDPMHRRTSDRPDVYGFLDVSQNNHMTAEAHFALLVRVRDQVAASGAPRPINNVKIYGADTGRYGSDDEAINRFWRNIFGGSAAARFHRPPSGLGLGDKARHHLRAARAFTDAFDLFATVPTWDLFTSDRRRDEAFTLHEPGRTVAVFFPASGQATVRLDKPVSGTWRLRWFDIDQGRWHGEAAPVEGLRPLLQPPTPGRSAALLSATD